MVATKKPNILSLRPDRCLRRRRLPPPPFSSPAIKRNPPCKQDRRSDRRMKGKEISQKMSSLHSSKVPTVSRNFKHGKGSAANKHHLLGGQDELPPPVDVCGGGGRGRRSTAVPSARGGRGSRGGRGVVTAQELPDLPRRELGLADVAKVPRQVDGLACEMKRNLVRATIHLDLYCSLVMSRARSFFFPSPRLTSANLSISDEGEGESEYRAKGGEKERKNKPISPPNFAAAPLLSSPPKTGGRETVSSDCPPAAKAIPLSSKLKRPLSSSLSSPV